MSFSGGPRSCVYVDRDYLPLLECIADLGNIRTEDTSSLCYR